MTCLLISILLAGQEPLALPLARPIVIKVDGKQYKAVLLEEIATPRVETKTTDRNHAIKARQQVLEQTNPEQDPLYNFTTTEWEAIHLSDDEWAEALREREWKKTLAKRAEDYDREMREYARRRAKAESFPARFSSLEEYHGYLANPDSERYRHLRRARIQAQPIKCGPGADD